ncbi:fam-c protein [Plasmodium chabaudi chabaudi]|uniref:Fam-c protein n=1 Tax=Plasmodium chabaudi chabaudi TaxID=31271 RepID=A0A1C6W824_PLACU|nr:fam-c protein [Plasmodium chabaudi chabaudi]
MNKRIFSLVCIAVYALLAASIHCSEQKHDRSKTSGLRSRIIRAIKQIKRSSKKNDIEFKGKAQLNSNNNNPYPPLKHYDELYGDDALWGDCCCRDCCCCDCFGC